MKYKSKKDAKQWSMETFGRGGLIATIPTPFHDDTLEIHEEDLRNTVRYVIDCKNDGLFFLGNVGEFYSMTREERMKVVEIVADEAKGKIAIMPQTAHHAAKESIMLSQHAQEAGCDMVVLLTSYFQCATQQGIKDWWREVCSQLEIGTVFYDSPLSHLATSDTLAELALEIPNICGVKDGRPDLMWCSDVERKAKYQIWVSDPLEDHWPQEMKIMKNPCHCTSWHLWLLQQPGYTPIRDYTDLIMAGKWEEGLAKYSEIEAGRQLLNEFFWPNYRKGVYVVAFWKYWLELKGVVSGHKVRSPLLNMTEQEEAWLRSRVDKLAKGEGPTTMDPIKPYSLQVSDTSSVMAMGV
ncbi:MAG TPA: dihydrodipicolinate synthase family protein [Phycisphaerales bacterium]|nr:dihydrodipicolinate synthase family protein [Phycisphaerales bacterium]